MAAVDTKFGWTFQGSFSINSSLTMATNVCLLEIGVESDVKEQSILQKVRELDANGINNEESMKPENHLFVIGRIERKGDRYEVSKLWKEMSTEVACNNKMGMKPLKSLTNRLCQNKELVKEYDTAISSYMNEDHDERVKNEVASGHICFRPHQPVIGTQTKTTKL